MTPIGSPQGSNDSISIEDELNLSTLKKQITMAIKYAIQQINRKGLTLGTTTTNYYAQAKYDGVTSQADIAQMVSQISAISVGDVLSVLNTVSMLLSIELANGRIVDLGDLGRFRATLRSKSCDKPESFKREMIYGNRVIFVPGHQVRTKMKNASYLKSDVSSSSVGTGEKPHTTPGHNASEEPGSKTPPASNETEGTSKSEKNNGGL